MESQPKLDSVQQPSVLLVVFSHYSAHQVNYLLQGDAEGDDDGRGLVQYRAVLDVVILQEVIQQLLLVRASAASCDIISYILVRGKITPNMMHHCGLRA